jgi:hypothetical protein
MNCAPVLHNLHRVNLPVGGQVEPAKCKLLAQVADVDEFRVRGHKVVVGHAKAKSRAG